MSGSGKSAAGHGGNAGRGASEYDGSNEKRRGGIDDVDAGARVGRVRRRRVEERVRFVSRRRW